MSLTLGARILAAFSAALNPTLAADVAGLAVRVTANDSLDAEQATALTAIGIATTNLAADVASLRDELNDSEVLDADQAARLDTIAATIQSISDAFPDTTIAEATTTNGAGPVADSDGTDAA